MKIAVICGAPNHNTGMMFVDRAIYLYLKSKELLANTTFFCFQLKAKNKVIHVRRRKLPLPIKAKRFLTV